MSLCLRSRIKNICAYGCSEKQCEAALLPNEDDPKCVLCGLFG
jgi:hypothetical protein